MVCRYFKVKSVKVMREWKIWEVVPLTSLTLDEKTAFWGKSIAQGHMIKPRVWSWSWIFWLRTEGSFSHKKNCFQQFFHEISFFTNITVYLMVSLCHFCSGKWQAAPCILQRACLPRIANGYWMLTIYWAVIEHFPCFILLLPSHITLR